MSKSNGFPIGGIIVAGLILTQVPPVRVGIVKVLGSADRGILATMAHFAQDRNQGVRDVAVAALRESQSRAAQAEGIAFPALNPSLIGRISDAERIAREAPGFGLSFPQGKPSTLAEALRPNPSLPGLGERPQFSVLPPGGLGSPLVPPSGFGLTPPSAR